MTSFISSWNCSFFTFIPMIFNIWFYNAKIIEEHLESNYMDLRNINHLFHVWYGVCNSCHLFPFIQPEPSKNISECEAIVTCSDLNWVVKMLPIGTFNINSVPFYGLMVPGRWCTDSKVDRWTAARNVHKQSLMEFECKYSKSNIFKKSWKEPTNGCLSGT